MEQRRVFIDKTEVVFLVPTKKETISHNLVARDISRIQFDKSVTNILGFIKSETETITVVSGKLRVPIVYKKNQCKKYFDEYKRELEEFAKQHYITFTNNTKDLV